MRGSVVCKKIAPVGEVLVKVFPTEIIDSVGEEDAHFFGAIDTATRALRGGGVFSVSDEIEGAALLHYINVAESYRNEGVGSKLLDYSLKSMKSAGTKYVLYRETADNPINLIISYNFATDNGFIPIVENEKILSYKMETILGGKFAMKMMGKKDSLNNIIGIDDPKDNRIIKFNEDNSDVFYKLEKGNYDPCYSGFYVKDDKIVGALRGVLRDKTVILGDVYLETGYESDDIYTSLLEYVLILLTQDVRVENIVIQVTGEKRRSIINSLLGEPDAERNAIELVRYL
ncbi:GNAT family N-acetyltransferase [Butyrivibrio sp. AE3004]|uniref:GNAT family N-acetyltransferase n=1 Tax=Butyrivibrio sp. AE3004 TaxID=1506994 RepID=UPI0004942042|nr:GNAT family N-acetyltransferase [Butyrivibrio sp. AE3004]